MSETLIFAIVTITLALIFYTIGVLWERKSKILSKKHIALFWLGLVCDTTGTLSMSKIAASGASSMGDTGRMLHGITGFLAIVLMLFHALWATWVLYKNDQAEKENFHKFSIIVWAIWLIPYLIGMMLGMGK